MTFHNFSLKIYIMKRNYTEAQRVTELCKKSILPLETWGKEKNCPSLHSSEPLTQNIIMHYINRSVSYRVQCSFMLSTNVGFGIFLPAGHLWQWSEVTNKLIKNVPARHLSICHNMSLCAMHFTMK